MIRFFVPGDPKPAGSKRGFLHPHLKRVMIVDACDKSKDWKGDVKAFAAKNYNGPLIEGPISVLFEFFFVRPKSHFGSGKNSAKLKTGAPAFHTTKPDALKLSRAVEDALTGIIWKDDSQIVDERLTKNYGEKPGVMISISEPGAPIL